MTNKICEAEVTHNPTNNAFGRFASGLSPNCPNKVKETRLTWSGEIQSLCGVHLRQHDKNEKRSAENTAKVRRMGAKEQLVAVLNSELEKGKESVSFNQIVTLPGGTLADLVVRAKSL